MKGMRREEGGSVEHTAVQLGVPRVIVCSVLLTVFVGLPLSAQGYPRPTQLERVSVASDEEEGDSWSGGQWLGSHLDISGDGHVVAFESKAENLVPADRNHTGDVFVRDLSSGSTWRVSVGPEGVEANGASYHPAITADGDKVAFASNSTNLIPGGTGFFPSGPPENPSSTENPYAGHIYLHHIPTAITGLVSQSSEGEPGNGPSYWPDISADGRYVAFASSASNLVPNDTNGARDYFVRDLLTRRTERVSVGGDGNEGLYLTGSTCEDTQPFEYTPPSISDDGRVVAFTSDQMNLVPEDVNASTDVFVRDRLRGTTELASQNQDGRVGNLRSTHSSLSSNGRYVAFTSYANNLVPGDEGTLTGIFVRDRATGFVEQVSVTSEGAPPALGDSVGPVISADGRLVAFVSKASNLTDAMAPGIQIYLHDRWAGTTELVSGRDDGETVAGNAFSPAFAAGGREIAFSTEAPLLPSDGNAKTDVYVRDRGPYLGVTDVEASVSDGKVHLRGTTTLEATVVSANEGPRLGVQILYRPEREDLLLRWTPDLFPSTPMTPLPPGLEVGVRFESQGVRYEVRATRLPPDASSSDPHFAFLRCESVCVQVRGLPGGWGTGGEDIRTALTLTDLGAENSVELGSIEAFARWGEAGAIGTTLSLPDISILGPTIDVAVAPANAVPEMISFRHSLPLYEGHFVGQVEAPDSDSSRLWLRLCADECTYLSREIG